MCWLILGVLCVAFAVTALVLWQKWAAPWTQIEQLVSQIARGERPSTFLINGGKGPHRVGLVLENICARQQERTRSDFVANVSHELRTPLSILRGYIEVLFDEPDPSREELTRILSIMERHSKRLQRLVDDLLSLAQLESSQAELELSIVRLDELFNNLIRDWKEKLAGKNLKVIVDLASETLMLRADGTRVEEALHNLLDNAVKFSREN